MNNKSSSKYWQGVLGHFSVDALLFIFAFAVGIFLRLPGEWTHALHEYWTGIVLGGLMFACIAYICGLYSLHAHNQKSFIRYSLLAVTLVISIGPMVGLFYFNFSTRIGRGAMLISVVLAYCAILLHHLLLHRRLHTYRERVALIVTSEEDEHEALLLRDHGSHYLKLVGVVHYHDYQPKGPLPILGSVESLSQIVIEKNLERVICTNASILDPKMSRNICRLRYSGVDVVPIIGIFEEMSQCVPLALVNPEWLMNASAGPHLLYIRKLKRAFDIITALTGLVCFWPFLLFGMALVKLASPGAPVLFHQTRSGRFGRKFKVIKLRTMKPDAEKDETPIWATNQDPRAIPGGNFLRQYRIDEIPQLWNVLRGEMSFVGPRPERPEFVEMLAKEIPFFPERLLVQPGITGWAQVNYPYGASVEDARHKLEYDLYYAKNMSLFLDIFILLDTVRIILRGGMKKSTRVRLPHYRAKGDTGQLPRPLTPAAAERR